MYHAASLYGPRFAPNAFESAVNGVAMLAIQYIKTKDPKIANKIHAKLAFLESYKPRSLPANDHKGRYQDAGLLHSLCLFENAALGAVNNRIPPLPEYLTGLRNIVLGMHLANSQFPMQTRPWQSQFFSQMKPYPFNDNKLVHEAQ